MIDLYPAIDLRGGRCVRLYQGDYDRETVYGDDPVAQARAFEAEGASWIHVVDLDAARTGEPVNRASSPRSPRRSVPVQTGGGVRDEAAAEALFDAGVARVVLGTAALEDPRPGSTPGREHPVAVGLDARGREVAVRGWPEGSGSDLFDLAAAFADAGVAASSSPRSAATAPSRVPTSTAWPGAGRTPIPVIASGGVGTLDHLDDTGRAGVGRA